MLDTNQTITHLYEKWEVTASKTAEADKAAKNINPNVGHSVNHESYDYKKVKKVGEKRLFPSVAEDFNTQAHNRGIRYYEVAGSEVDHAATEEVEAGAEKTVKAKKGK